MKRLVYSPEITAYIKADTGVYDISEYITQFNVTRKINQVSTAELTLRNPEKKWTEYRYTDPVSKKKTVGPVFHPMDPITIILKRLPQRPVQVFTGYCDSTPYLQLFPGTVTLSASCTLKKLLYTYFDPGLPFFWEFLSQHGWTPNFLQGGISNFEAEKEHAEPGKEIKNVRHGDSGIGELLYDILKTIGGWPDSTILIEEIPPTVIELVSNLFETFKQDSEESSTELTAFLHKIVGTASYGAGGGPAAVPGNVGGAGPESGSPISAIDVGRAMITVTPSKINSVAIAKGMTTVEHESNFGTAPGWDEEHTGGVLGYWQIQQSTHPQYSSKCCMNLLCSTKASYEISEHWTNWDPWSASDFGMSDVPASAYQPYIQKAEKAIAMGPFTSTPAGEEKHHPKQGG